MNNVIGRGALPEFREKYKSVEWSVPTDSLVNFTIESTHPLGRYGYLVPSKTKITIEIEGPYQFTTWLRNPPPETDESYVELAQK